MKKVVIIGILILLVVVFGDPSKRVLGWVRGEAFFRGIPSSVWAHRFRGGTKQQTEARQEFERAAAEGVPVLIELLGTVNKPGFEDAEVRYSVAEVLGTLGPDANTAKAALINALEDKDPHVQGVAAYSIPKIQTPASEAVVPLTKLLRSGLVVPAARALSEYKSEAKEALNELLVVLQDESRPTEDRWNAARTIGKLGPDGISSLPVLIEMTKHKEATIREHCAEAIGDIGPTAKDGIPALVDCLKDPAVRVRRDAVRSLGYIGEPSLPAVPAMLALLDVEKEELVRHATKEALRKIAPKKLEEYVATHPKPKKKD